MLKSKESIALSERSEKKKGVHHDITYVIFFFFFVNTGVCLQGLALARQALCHLSHTSSLFYI
jgi:hypothetical protein